MTRLRCPILTLGPTPPWLGRSKHRQNRPHGGCQNGTPHASNDINSLGGKSSGRHHRPLLSEAYARREFRSRGLIVIMDHTNWRLEPRVSMKMPTLYNPRVGCCFFSPLHFASLRLPTADL